MIPAGIYLLKTCLFLLAFYLPFTLLLKRTTFFNINRAYLVMGLLLSFVLPLYNGFAENSSYTPPDIPFMEPIVAQTELVISKASESRSFLEVGFLLSAIYLIGIAFRLIILSRSITSISKIKKLGQPLVYRNLKVFKTSSSVPFVFLHNVFLPEANEDRGILEHEAAHVNQYHWIDLLIVECVSIVLWFNPLIVFYKRALKQQHEYLADRATIKSGITIEEYLLTIKRQIELALPSPLISEFYFSSIKNRIHMLTKNRTSFYQAVSYFLVLPLIICLLMAFSSRKDIPIIASFESDPIQDEIALSLPIDKKNFSFESGYGERVHPIYGDKRLHTGIDLKADEGVPVIASEGGVVVKAVLDGPWGNIVVVLHNDTYSTSYSHLQSMNVKKGDKVKKGDQIGLVGNTGVSTKSHLHFELHKNGKAVDPVGYLPGIN